MCVFFFFQISLRGFDFFFFLKIPEIWLHEVIHEGPSFSTILDRCSVFMSHQTDCAHSLQAKRTTKQVQKKEREKKWIMTPLLPLHSWQLKCWICGICFMCKLSSVWKIHFFHSLSQLFDPCFCELLSSQFLSELADIHKLLFLNLSVCANVWRRCSDQESSPA